MAQDLTGYLIAEKYRLDALWRRGDSVDLYRATHRLMDKPFTVAVLRQALATDSVEVEDFFGRCRLLASITDPGVPSVIDFGTDRDGFVYCIYSAFPLDTLSSVIAHDGQFPVHSAVSLGRQVASAIGAAHEKGLVHGNLTADNVLLSSTVQDGTTATVVDFGSPDPIAADSDELNARDFAYLSPEKCAGSDRPTEASDVYSIGILLYEMLAGVPPFSAERPTDLMMKHIEEMPAPLSSFRSDVPQPLEASILKALSKDPSARHQGADELRAELETLEASTVTAASAAAGSRGGFGKTILMMVVGVGLLAAALIYATSVKQTDPLTSLQPDANGQPVQPLNPATGIEERNLASVPGMGTDVNSNMSIPGTMPGGDGYDPWANSRSLQPPGGTVTIDPNSQSPFTMDPGCTMLPSGLIICPTQMPAASPSPTPRTTAPANTNARPASTPATPQRTPTPAPARPASPAPANTPAGGTEAGPEGADPDDNR
jgi:serine/threonine protein kinase